MQHRALRGNGLNCRMKRFSGMRGAMVQTSTQTSSPLSSHRNRCTDSPRMVVQRPSVKPESPMMQRADDFAFLDPAVTERTA